MNTLPAVTRCGCAPSCCWSRAAQRARPAQEPDPVFADHLDAGARAPQDTIRAITQTADGYLWLGTDEGLARFDGYEFVVFHKANGDLPANSITALAPATDGSPVDRHSERPDAVSRQRVPDLHHQGRTAGRRDHRLYVDHAGTLWIVAGIYLSRFRGRASSPPSARATICR